MKILLSALLLSAGGLLGTSLLAQPSMDTDGDGSVSRAEFEAAATKAAGERFSRLDTDANGLLSREELNAGRGTRRRGPEMGAAIDTDGDGAWSLAELQAAQPGFDAERFAELDRNGDGLINADERPMRGPRGEHRRMRGGPEGGR